MLKAILKNRKGLLFLLCLAIVAMAYAHIEINRVAPYFQRVYLPPAQIAPEGTDDGTGSADGANDAGSAGSAGGASALNGGLREARYAADETTKALEGACENATLYTVSQPAPVSVEDGQSASARLLGIQSGYYALHQLTLNCGRLIYPDEMLTGDRVVIMDEQLAVSLFQYAEPLEQEVLIAGQKYRIVGIVRSGKRVGDEMDYSLYIPYRSLEKSELALTALVYEASPVQGAGGWSAFETAVQSLGEAGTTISLPKERMNAAMPFRMLAVLCGAAIGLFCLRLLNRAFRAVTGRYRALLRDQYAARLLWWIFWRGALLALGYAACAFVLARLFVYLVEPVYTFPEWVPAVLVEPKDIQTAFWNVWQKPASMLEFRTPELLRLRFYRELMGWSAGAAALLTGALWGRMTQAAAPSLELRQSAETTEPAQMKERH